MESGIKINATGITAFNNALHAQFHNQMYNLVDRWHRDIKVINVKAELMREWKELIKTEIDINRELTASLDTARLAALDKERDEMIVYLFASIRSARRSFIATQKEAAARLYMLVKKYGGLQKESFSEQTIHTDGLLHDLGKTPYQADITTLGLGDVVQQLTSKNDEFRTASDERSATRATTKLPSAKIVRPQNDAIFARVCLLIEASFLLNTVAATKADIAALAEKMNQQIAEHKTTHKQTTTRGGQIKPGKADGE